MAIITQADLVAGPLLGVNLTLDDGTAYPAQKFTDVINAAVAKVARALDIPLGDASYETVTDEAHTADSSADLLFRLNKGPVQSITAAGVYYGQTQVLEIPMDWINLIEPKTGELQVVPISGGVTTIAPALGTLIYGPRKLHAQWRFTYTAGYKASDIPEDIKQLLMIEAAIPVLITAGDLIAGAGIANYTISGDGWSQSVGTTSSATNSGYGANIIELRKLAKDLYASIRATERGPLFCVA